MSDRDGASEGRIFWSLVVPLLRPILLTAIFFNVAFFPMHFSGLAGMPRRIPDYALQFTDFNMLSTVGAFGFGLSQLIFLWAVVKCIRGGVKAADKSWEGAEGLEWTVPSPAPYHTFETAPIIK